MKAAASAHRRIEKAVKCAEFARSTAHRLRALRAALEYRSAAAFARAIDMPASTVRRAEAGELVSQYWATLLGVAVSRRFNVSLDWLWSGEPGSRRYPVCDPSAKVVLFPYWRVPR
jgi:hypothetical protein